MANGDHDWTAGETVTAANVDDYLQLQTIEKFATSAARDAALAARKREGMVTYQDDANSLTNYSGAAWSTIGPVNGALTTWTPVIVQGVTPTLTVTYAAYQRVGRMVHAWANVSITSGGTANTVITCSLPFTAATSGLQVGTGQVLDQSAVLRFRCFCTLLTTTTVNFLAYATNGGTDALYQMGNGTQGPTFQIALASTDTVQYEIHYEAAADA